jgi:chromosome segregation ATPase
LDPCGAWILLQATMYTNTLGPQSFRNGGWDASIYSSPEEYFAEEKGGEAEVAKLREQAKRMSKQIRKQESELGAQDRRLLEQEGEIKELRGRVDRRNARLQEQEGEIGEL